LRIGIYEEAAKGIQGAAIDRTTNNQSRQSECAAAFDAHAGRLRRVISGMGFGQADRDDILQDVFVAASRQERLPPGDEAGRWLARVTVNRCLLEMRRRKRFRLAVRRRVQAQGGGRSSLEGPEQQAMRAEELEIVRRAMLELDGPLLAAMVLTYYCGLSSAEAGEILEVNASTLRSRLREARMKLAEGLLDRGVGL